MAKTIDPRIATAPSHLPHQRYVPRSSHAAALSSSTTTVLGATLPQSPVPKLIAIRVSALGPTLFTLAGQTIALCGLFGGGLRPAKFHEKRLDIAACQNGKAAQ